MKKFIGADREQGILMPYDLGDCLPEHHLARFVVDVVDKVDMRFTPNTRVLGQKHTIQGCFYHVLVKGGNTFADSENSPRELGVGQYNVSNLGIQPSYGLWARHAKNLRLENCSFNYEKRDSRFAIVLDDVVGAKIDSVKMVKAEDNDHVIKLLNSSGVTVRNTIYYKDVWSQSPAVLPSGAIETPFLP
jgi:hypothetical protein